MNCNQNQCTNQGCKNNMCNHNCQSCGCQNFDDGQWWNSNINNNCQSPLVAPTRVCTTCQNQYVEQPVICPIECRRVSNVVLVPRYYPRYFQTSYVQSNNNSVF